MPCITISQNYMELQNNIKKRLCFKFHSAIIIPIIQNGRTKRSQPHRLRLWPLCRFCGKNEGVFLSYKTAERLLFYVLCFAYAPSPWSL